MPRQTTRSRSPRKRPKRSRKKQSATRRKYRSTAQVDPKLISLYAFNGWTKFAQEALKQGADVNSVEKGTTPLILAATFSTPAMVKLLLDHDADVNLANTSDLTALMQARTAEIAELLVNADASLNAFDKYGRTALMHASQASNVELVELLLRAGANVDAQDNKGRTALMLAAERSWGPPEEKINTVETLLYHDADTEITDTNGKTALMLATDTETQRTILSLKRLEDVRKQLFVDP